MKMIKAYFDKYGEITVELSNLFYEGKTDVLFVEHRNNKTKLDIKEVKVGDEYTTYFCKSNIEIIFGDEYTVIEEHNFQTLVEFRRIIKQPAFDKEFYYEGYDLGNQYSKDSTTFKVWTPMASKVFLRFEIGGLEQVKPMNRGCKGVWDITIEGDLELCSYNYLVKVNGIWNDATDPYAISSTPNTKNSVVIDLEKTKVDLNRDKLSEFISHTDAVIYELHVRDFSVDGYSGIENKGKFLGLIEEGTKSRIGLKTGFDYLKSMGFTHLQLLPIYDFGSVDELNQFDFYNWGYDPVAYNVPEGSYATDVNDPYSRIVELKQMISKFHTEDIRINMDVVYNHMFDQETSAFDKLMPGYYFRSGENGEVSNGSFCGNDVESRSLMVRKYIVDSVNLWHQFYGIDGFRFDLMGIIDVDTINQIREMLPSDVMIYGEGWQMPTLMDTSFYASMFNYKQIPKIGHFNDRFRDSIKGKTQHEEADVKGFITGDLSKFDDLASSLMGSVIKYNTSKQMFDEPHQSVNYLECHDNHTLYDKMLFSNSNESDEMLSKRARLGALITMVSQGISFIHAGQEFNRTKDKDHNSYKSIDQINKFDWSRKEQRYIEVKYVKELIALRKAFKPFRFDSKKEIKKHVKITKLADGILKYQIKNVNKYCDYSEIDIYINGTENDLKISIIGEYDVFAYDNRASDEPLNTITDVLTLKSVSGTIIMKKGEK